jgi:type II secretory pathway pseudopilin PulG
MTGVQDRHAFTLPELILGMLLLVLVGAATAAVASSVTRGWNMGETNQTSSLTITRTMLRMQDKMQRARFFGQLDRGSIANPAVNPPAAILFWRDDDNNDGKMQLDETQLLTYDPTGKELVVWEVVFPNATTRATQNGPFPTSMLTANNAVSTYKSMVYANKYTITRNVLAAAFDVITPSAGRPAFEFRLKFDGTRGQAVQYGTATQRMITPG